MEIGDIVKKAVRCEKEIGKRIIGQKEVIRMVLIAILSGGNVLLEGVPGVGKTELVKTLSKVLNLKFSRIQFTPDLMPADVIGTNMVIKDDEGKNAFSFERGPIFANLVLADEINRATPKTQSALLEAMQEGTVTSGKVTHPLPEPFMVLATENPIEMEGTYPLPEAQLDRFLFKLNVKFPSFEELKNIIDVTTTNRENELNSILNDEEILSMRKILKDVPIAETVKEYALKTIVATHPDSEHCPQNLRKYISFGSSPRGAQGLINASKINAVLEERYNVSFEDIKFIAYSVLRHRIILSFEAISDGVTVEDIIKEILASVKI